MKMRASPSHSAYSSPAAKRSNICSTGTRVFDPEERSNARSERRTHRAMAARERRVRSMSCDARALRAPQEQGEYRGRLFFGDFLLATQKKVTAPRHERLVVNGHARFTNPSP